MGLLDSVLGGVLGNNHQSSPLSGLLGGLLGGGQQSAQGGGMLGSLLGGGQQPAQGGGGMLGGLLGGGQQPAAGGGMGGLGGLLGMFQQAGLGNVAQSWVGHGANQQISPDQLHQVFGQERIQQMSQQTGLPPQDLLSQLSQHLPNVVDRMTPNGQMPEGHADPFAGGTTTAFDGPGIPEGKTFRT